MPRNYLRVQVATWPGCSRTAALVFFDDDRPEDVARALHVATETQAHAGGVLVACTDAPGLEAVRLATPCGAGRHVYEAGQPDCARCGVALDCSYVSPKKRRCRSWATAMVGDVARCKLHTPRPDLDVEGG